MVSGKSHLKPLPCEAAGAVPAPVTSAAEAGLGFSSSRSVMFTVNLRF
jgi:hypothetical protein